MLEFVLLIESPKVPTDLIWSYGVGWG